MNTIMKRSVALTAIFLLTACGTEGNEPANTDSAQIQAPVAAAASVSNSASLRQPADLDLTDATMITLSDSGISIEGTGAEADGSVITITSAGIYAVSGSLADGRIIVNAPKEDVAVALNGADITCSYGSPLYIYKAGTATVHLAEGTENALTDGSAYTFDDEYSSAADEEPNACLYSKADLVIQGAGTLTVTANCSNGITSKDTLQIYDSTISVQAVNNGINGKDSNTIDSASITVVCGGDAIRSTNDTDETLGWVSVSASTLNLTAGEDGIQAETSLTMSEGSYTITSGGGSSVTPSDDISAKGIKAGTALTLTGGTYILDCSDDAVHSNGDVTVSGGVYTVSSGDDAFHADETLDVSGGEVNILNSYEGLEGTAVSVSGGTIYIVSSDDGVNAAGGADGSGFGGFGGFGHGNSFGGNSDSRIEISGGYLVVKAGGDGLDSNGNTVMSGGTVIVSSTGQGDGALDYDGTFTLSGGTLLATDGGNMPQSPNDASQYTVFLGFDSILPAGTYVSLADESQSFVFELPVNAGSLVFSSPDLTGGAAYTISYGGDYDGQSADGICSGGTYSGGTDLTELTLTDYITTYGNRGGMGNPGGRHGGNMGGAPDGGRGEFPADGEAPGMPPDGQLPEDVDMGGGYGGKRGEFPADGTAPDIRPDGQAPGMPSDGELPEDGDMDGGYGGKRGEFPADGTAPDMRPDGELPEDGDMGGAFGGKRGEMPVDDTVPDMPPDGQVPEDGGTDGMPENSNMPGGQGNQTNRDADGQNGTGQETPSGSSSSSI